jgi:hypothetical protein
MIYNNYTIYLPELTAVIPLALEEEPALLLLFIYTFFFLFMCHHELKHSVEVNLTTCIGVCLEYGRYQGNTPHKK